MNNTQRFQIDKWIEQLEEIKKEVEDMQCEEEDKYENLPEGIQDGEKGENFLEVIGNLQDAVDNIEMAIGDIQDARDAGK